MKINKKTINIAIFLSIAYLIIHLLIMKDYAISWDFHYHLYGGFYHLGLPIPKISDPAPVPFSLPDSRLTFADPFGPFTQIIPTLSYYLLYEKWQILPFDHAYNLPMVFIGAAGIGLIFLFAYETVGLLEALISSIFLAFLPSYFGYLHNNMKDIPNAFFFTLSVYLFWRLCKYKRFKDLMWAAVVFAIAFNIKINSAFIPVVCFVWFVLVRGKFKIIIKKKLYLPIFYFILAPFLAVLVWWPFWPNPIQKLLEIPFFYSHNTINMPVLLFGKIFRSGINVPWHYPYLYIFITTPIPILICFIVGLIVLVKKAIKNDDTALLFLALFFIPLLRYFSPKGGAIDGMRHFMEVVFPLSAIAGIGGALVYRRLIAFCKTKTIGTIIGTIVLIILIKNVVYFHPYQASFFNAFIGGVNGANGKFDIDFWGTPQKEAIVWLNKNAPFGSSVNIAMAQSSAAMYLRPDLLKNANSKDIKASDYSVVLNRESFFDWLGIKDYVKTKTLKNEIVFSRKIGKVPLVWVFKN